MAGDMFNKASQAREEWNEAVAEEDISINNVLDYMALSIPEDMQVGNIVNWMPSGHYTWSRPRYSSSNTGSVYTYISGQSSIVTNYTIETKEFYSGKSAENISDIQTTWNGGTNLDFTINQWKVLSIDNINKTVKLVSTTVGIPVALYGATGYNNGVKLLNDSCSKLYGGDIVGVEVHNINMNDIEELMTTEQAASIITTAKNSTTPAYGETYTNEYTEDEIQYRNSSGEYIVNTVYPRIYAEEALRKIDGTYSATGLDMSTAKKSFVSRANDRVSATSIQPTQTSYTLSNEDFTSALGTTTARILLPDDDTTTYWIASRCVSLDEKWCYFFMRFVYNGKLSAGRQARSVGDVAGLAFGLFPVVTLSSGTLSGSNETYSYTPAF